MRSETAKRLNDVNARIEKQEIAISSFKQEIAFNIYLFVIALKEIVPEKISARALEIVTDNYERTLNLNDDEIKSMQREVWRLKDKSVDLLYSTLGHDRSFKSESKLHIHRPLDLWVYLETDPMKLVASNQKYHEAICKIIAMVEPIFEKYGFNVRIVRMRGEASLFVHEYEFEDTSSFYKTLQDAQLTVTKFNIDYTLHVEKLRYFYIDLQELLEVRNKLEAQYRWERW